MKKFLAGSIFLCACISAMAQQKEGKVIYERVSHIQFQMPGSQEPIKQSRTDRYELNFANNQMVWQQLPEDIQAQESASNGAQGNFVFRVSSGSNDLIFVDFDKSKKVESREFADKKYLVSDSIRPGNWRLSEETMTILGYNCRKATTQRISTRSTVQMENGKMERTEVQDTSEVVAWFTLSVPVAVGPEYHGQLPGLILQLELNNGNSVYKAVEVSDKVNKSIIKEPTKGKKVTPEQFAAERKKMLDQMQQGGGGTIRFRAG